MSPRAEAAVVAVTVAVSCAFATPAPSPATTTQPSPPRPGFTYAAACQSEGLCAEGPWVAGDTVRVYRAAGDRSAVAFRLRRRQRVEGIRARYVVAEPGVVVFTAARPPFAAGDTAYVLGYVGEGYSTLWHRGVLREEAPDGPDVRVLRPARAQWWLEVRNATGARGWLPFPERGDQAPVPLRRVDGTD